MCVGISTGFIVSRFSFLSVVWIYLTVQAMNIIKCVMGVILVKGKKSRCMTLFVPPFLRD